MSHSYQVNARNENTQKINRDHFSKMTYVFYDRSMFHIHNVTIDKSNLAK